MILFCMVNTSFADSGTAPLGMGLFPCMKPTLPVPDICVDIQSGLEIDILKRVNYLFIY